MKEIINYTVIDLMNKVFVKHYFNIKVIYISNNIVIKGRIVI